MIVHHRSPRVELHRRNVDGQWEQRLFTEGSVILESLPGSPTRLSLEEIYEGVEWKRKGGWQVSENFGSETEYGADEDEDEDEDDEIW
jgi:hypothetical protein